MTKREKRADRFFMSQSNQVKIKYVLFKSKSPLLRKDIARLTNISEAVVKTTLNRDPLKQEIESQVVEGLKRYVLRYTARQQLSERYARKILDLKQEEENEQVSRKYALIIDKFTNLLEDKIEPVILEAKRKGLGYIPLDFYQIAKCDPELSDYLLNSPQDALACIGEALKDRFDFSPHVSIVNVPNVVPIPAIRTIHNQKFICTTGQVINATQVFPVVTFARFECPGCGNVIPLPQMEKKFLEPNRCSCGRKGKFRLLSKDRQNVVKLTLETPVEETVGNRPSRLYAEIVGGLCEKVVSVGERYLVTGIIQEMPKMLKQGGQSTELDWILQINHFTHVDKFKLESLQFSDEELAKAKCIAQKMGKPLFDDLYKGIHGYADVKAICGYQPFSTNLKGERPQHSLLVGSPGIAKTDLARISAQSSPIHMLSDGKGVTGVGLIGCVRKDDYTGSFLIEAGVLPRSHGGVALIDEFEKANPEDLDHLHTPMEHEVMHVHKANVHTTLNCSTSIMATANPDNGILDVFKPISQQLKNVRPSILDRFDHVIIMKDIVNEKKDSLIADAVLERNVIIDPATVSFMRKYVAYAQRFHPVVPEGVGTKLKQFYVNMRAISITEAYQGKRVTPRLLKSLIRLSKSIARASFSDVVTVQHCEEAIRLTQVLSEAQGISTIQVEV